jgi:soluble lytic murein transglycosylase-like protein
MSVFNNIQAIQARMREIQSRFGNDSVKFTPPKGMGGMTQTSVSSGVSGSSGSTGITFEQLLATKLKENNPTEGAKELSSGTTGDVKNPALSAKASDYDDIIKEASQKYGVDEKFIKAIIQQESGFNPNATSWVGAMGLMQLMPETARGLGVKNGYDPKDNIMGGVKYIKEQLDRFGNDKEKALAAYNAGPGAVTKHGGIPPYQETRNYVKNIMSIYNSMK